MEGESIGESVGGSKYRWVSWREKVKVRQLDGESIGESAEGESIGESAERESIGESAEGESIDESAEGESIGESAGGRKYRRVS